MDDLGRVSRDFRNDCDYREIWQKEDNGVPVHSLCHVYPPIDHDDRVRERCRCRWNGKKNVS